MSSVLVATTNDAPAAVDLYTPWAPDTTSLMLSWSQS